MGLCLGFVDVPLCFLFHGVLLLHQGKAPTNQAPPSPPIVGALGSMGTGGYPFTTTAGVWPG